LNKSDNISSVVEVISFGGNTSSVGEYDRNPENASVKIIGTNTMNVPVLPNNSKIFGQTTDQISSDIMKVIQANQFMNVSDLPVLFTSTNISAFFVIAQKLYITHNSAIITSKNISELILI
jgi:hypothetical protein